MAGYGAYLQKHVSKFDRAYNDGTGITSQKDPEATAAGCVIVAFFDWMFHGFK